MEEITQTTQHEHFNITFKGPSLDTHEMSVEALANSLLALKRLAQKSVKIAHGKEATCDMKVVGGFRAGSFGVELIITYGGQIAGAVITIVGSLVAAIQLVKWTKNKPFDKKEKTDNSNIAITNCDGEVRVFNNCPVSLLELQSARHEIDMLTTPLDFGGVNSIELDGNDANVSVDTTDRGFIKPQGEIPISDDTEEVEVFVSACSLLGSGKYWRFSDDGESDYPALVEDIDFLNDVKSGKYVMSPGDRLIVDIQTIRIKKDRKIVTNRIILKVKSYLPATS